MKENERIESAVFLALKEIKHSCTLINGYRVYNNNSPDNNTLWIELYDDDQEQTIYVTIHKYNALQVRDALLCFCDELTKLIKANI